MTQLSIASPRYSSFSLSDFARCSSALRDDVVRDRVIQEGAVLECVPDRFFQG